MYAGHRYQNEVKQRKACLLYINVYITNIGMIKQFLKIDLFVMMVSFRILSPYSNGLLLGVENF